MDVLMPQLGETVKEGTLSVWFKQPGEMVAAGEKLFEIETDKTAMEVQALSSGLLTDVRVKAGETVPVGSVLATIAGNGAAVAAPAPEPPRAAVNGHAIATAPTTLDPFNEVRTPTRIPIRAAVSGIRITPLARRLIQQNGLDAQELAARKRAEGGARIAARDVEAALSARGAPAPAPSRVPEPTPIMTRAPAADGKSVPLNRIRQQTGKHLAESWRTAPHVFQAVEIDFSAVSRARDTHKAAFRERHGADLTFLPFIARATCLALAAFPQVNAILDGDRLVLSSDVNLGIAVDLSHDGLVVPVVRQAQNLNLAGLAQAITRLVESARAGRLTPDEMRGGTYTISNNGAFGTLFTAPIINLPQVAILSTDAIRKRPVVVETEYGDAIVARPVGIVAQSFDHRAFDGAYSAAYLGRLKQIIETRDWAAELA